jgi:hypothetical protein
MNIELDNINQLNRFKFNPPHPSYIAGLIDGDGCIFIRKIKDGYQSGFTISQCRTNVLQIIRYHFGGTITSSKNRNDKTENLMNKDNYFYKYNIRNQFNLIIRNNEYQILLNYLHNSFIIKEEQYKNLYEFNKIANLPNNINEKDNLHVNCSKLNNKCIIDEINLKRLNIEYISGLFDAEGCIFININNFNNFYISISQKNHPLILQEIVTFLGFGKVSTNEYELIIGSKYNCLKFIFLIKNHLIVKYNQCEAFELFLTTNDINIKKEMYTICNKEKHEIEIFNCLNQNNIGKDMYIEKNNLINIKKQICKEICLKQFYKEKSEKMKGDRNHNFGKFFSSETKKKMSSSIINSKRLLTDETIIEVRKLLTQGYKNIDIQNTLNIPRHTVTRIKNGEIVCKNEEKLEKKSLTQIQVNLSKRKITTDEIITVIEKINKNWTPMEILDYLIKIRNTNNIVNNLTIDIIKNIKRNLKNEKHVIYESEISKEKYDYYLFLINNFSYLKSIK